MSANWCRLTVEEKVLVILYIVDKPVSVNQISFLIFLFDKVFGCEHESASRGSDSP